ncbi:MULTISPECIES: TonB-dependent receptor [unclassified Caulobacter]|uniref:TonB-dependent receptor n=1 Tax=unclassified Caulobacter TaxID=2648921 RepID=UPI000D3D5E03|nr:MULTISPECIES: TonB-dependent receptor [unclassified Caulobacter]PTS88750.1 TonB-dependent receptor [Caulobacter sp. HMWF009]PTT08327.1 TonB-dependent receptor [Caulobacter sp. HMWF025]
MIRTGHGARVRALGLKLMIGASVGALGMVAAGGSAAAQAPAGADTVDEIVVTGLRASLSRAIDVKRNAAVIVDSIASEDLGKFPDSNVAESLQRITGVSIDRSSGEGRFVTVRGFGPSFNNVLVNGRTLATENAGRQFSFDLLAAELISGADIYKSNNATLQEGGIGSTINVKTARPFDIRGSKAILSAKADYEDLSGKTSPDVFGLFSTRLADGRVGVLGSISYQKREARVDSIATNGYYKTTAGSGAGAIANVLFPANFDQISDQQDRERIGVTGTVQFKATDTLTLSADALYNKFTVDSTANSVGHFFSPADVSAITLDSNRTVTAFSQNANGHTDYINRTFNRPTELRAVGFNADWNPTDKINVKLDSSYSKAESNNGGNEIFAVIGFANAVQYSNSGNGLPNLTAARGFVDPTVGRAHFATREGSDVAETVYETRLDAVFKTDSEVFTALRFGGIYTDRTKDNTLVRTDNNVGCAYCGYGIAVPAGLLKPFNPGNFLNGESGNFPRQWLSFDSEAYFKFLETKAAGDLEDVAAGRPLGATAAYIASKGGYVGVEQPSAYSVHEKITGGYAQGDFEAMIGGLPWSATVGMRYVHTELTSSGTQQNLLDVLPIVGDSTAYTAVFAPTSTPTSKTTTYNNFLPSLNVKVDLTPDLVARFAATKTLSRANLTDVAPRIAFTSLRPGNLTAVGGNPDLRPFKSTNFDTSLEWYYQKAGFVTVGAFYKRIDDFILNGLATENFSITNSAGLYPGGILPVQVLRPRNSQSADVYGLEVGFQHTFDYLPAPFDGLGVSANATIVDSKANQTAAGTPFVLEGLGDSQNLVGFYAKGPIEVRVAYNHRDGFISTASNGTGGDPIFTKSQGQVDFQARYAISPAFSVFVEGTNLNDAKTETVGKYANQFLSLVDTGPRYAVGLRAQF